MIRPVRFFIVALFISCGSSTSIEKEEVNMVSGTITSSDGIQKIFYHDCYCNLAKSKITITHVYLGGIHGGTLTSVVTNDGFDFDLWYWPYDFKAFSFEKKYVDLRIKEQMLGDTISGKLILVGKSQSREKKMYKFNLRGNFKCVLKDSTYDYQNWYEDFGREQSLSRLRREFKTIENNPDSIIEQLNLPLLYLNSIPKEIVRLNCLKKLNLSSNEISSIDLKVLGNIDSLEELYFSRNDIVKISDSISSLKYLRVLDLSSNPIESLPEGFYSLNKLRSLDLSTTKIKVISDKIKYLQYLENLDISDTRIKQVPLEIFRLPNLKYLSLPDSMELFSMGGMTCPSLKKIRVSHEFLLYNRNHRVFPKCGHHYCKIFL